MVDNYQCFRLFKFFVAWFRDNTFKKVIGDAWQYQYRGSLAFQLMQKSKKVKSLLREWNHTKFGFTHKRIKQLTKKVQFIKGQPAK